MGFLRGIFGGSSGSKEARSAREAFPLAEEALEAWSATRASGAQLCCIYSSGEDSNRELQLDGRSRSWHFDYYLPASQSFFLVRVTDGKVKAWERKLQDRPVEYIYALYGSGDAARGFCDPLALPSDWVDTTAVAQTASAALYREMADVDAADLKDFMLLSMFFHGSYLRYTHLEWKPKFLEKPTPEAPCCAAILSHIDADAHDSLVVYADAMTGGELACERFRFPEYVILGNSADW
jgi:hypothetical protein